jgi:hypothetical protein
MDSASPRGLSMCTRAAVLGSAFLALILSGGGCRSVSPPEPTPMPEITDKAAKAAIKHKILVGCPSLSGTLSCGSLSADQAGVLNEAATRTYRDEESSYYVSPPGDWPKGLPQLCLAMSGGGLRSAATNIGVLQGLEDLGLLGRLDIMSSVSGGSYANYWFHAHQIAGKWGAATGVHPLLREGGAAQQAIERGDFIDVSSEASVVLLGPLFDWFPALLGEMTAPTSIVINDSEEYSERIKNYFLYDGRLFFSWQQPTWRELSQVKPFFIVNATGARERCPTGELTAFDNAFEITPRRWGSRGLGYSWDEPEFAGVLPLTAVAVSAAATDAPGSQCSALAWLGSPLGGEIPRFRDVGRWGIENHDAVLKTSYAEVLWGARVFLSDGGGIDNTGAFPLIARLCHRIIIVDATLPTQTSQEGPMQPQSEALDKLEKIVDRELEPQMNPALKIMMPNKVGRLGLC